jgi:hypothetical protein
MKERLRHGEMTLPAPDQAANIARPSERALNFPPALVAPQLAAILPWRRHPMTAMGTDQLHTPRGPPLPQGIRVASVVIDAPLRVLAWPPGAMAGHGNGVQGRLPQGHCGRGRRVQEVSQRHTLAVDHHHPLRPLAAFRRPAARPPVFAGAKLPSANASDQSRWPCASSGARKARQALSHTPCSSPSRRRRQQVLGEGNRAGSSCHRAPVRKTQRRPSHTGRVGIGLGPPRGEALSSGSNGAIVAHGASVRPEGSLARHGTPCTAYYRRGVPHHATSGEEGL